MPNDPIDDVIKREGGSKATNDSADGGGRTQYGISERSNPEAWADNKVSEAEAREIYERKYIKYPGFDKVADPHLQIQLIDYGVNSGPGVAIIKLQQILSVEVDGVLGPQTLAALLAASSREVNNQLVAARVRMIGKIVSKNISQVRFINNWLDRALQFLV